MFLLSYNNHSQNVKRNKDNMISILSLNFILRILHSIMLSIQHRRKENLLFNLKPKQENSIKIKYCKNIYCRAVGSKWKSVVFKFDIYM